LKEKRNRTSEGGREGKREKARKEKGERETATERWKRGRERESERECCSE